MAGWPVTIPYYAPHRKIPYSGAWAFPDTEFRVMWHEPLLDMTQLPPKSPACPLRKFGMSRATGAVTTYPFPCMNWERCGECAMERTGTQLGWLEHLFTRAEQHVTLKDYTGRYYETPFLRLVYYCEQPYSRDWLDTLAARRKERGAQYRWVQRAHPDFPEQGMLYIFASKDMNANGAPDRWCELTAAEAMKFAREAMKCPGVIRIDGSRKWAPKAPKSNPKYWALEAHKRDLLEGGRDFCQAIQAEWGERHVLISPLPDQVLDKRPVSWCKDMLISCVEGAKNKREARMEVVEPWMRPEQREPRSNGGFQGLQEPQERGGDGESISFPVQGWL